MESRRIHSLSGILAFLGVSLVLSACGGQAVDSGSSGPKGLSAAIQPDQPPGGDPSSAAAERKVVITTSVQLEVEKLPSAYADIARIARSAGGFVAESSLAGTAGNGSASLRIRVPASLHDDVVAQVRALGRRVLSESTNSKEVSEEYTDLEARMRNLQRSEAQYQTLLAQARTLDEIFNVNGRIETVRGQIEQAQGRINLLDNLSDFATVNVGIVVAPPSAGKAGLPGPREVFSDAWATALDVALILANVSAVLAVVLIWLLPLIVLVLVSLRLGRRLAPVAKRIAGP